MKAQTIVNILDILRQKKEVTYETYKNTRDNLEQKYSSEWLEGVMTEKESEMLYGAKQKYNELCECLEDFENHQW